VKSEPLESDRGSALGRGKKRNKSISAVPSKRSKTPSSSDDSSQEEQILDRTADSEGDGVPTTLKTTTTETAAVVPQNTGNANSFLVSQTNTFISTVSRATTFDLTSLAYDCILVVILE
jgi:hypothetical protein